MRKLFLICMFVLVLLVVGCQQKIVCNKPYILVGSECCLDKDDNGICDKDENTYKQPMTKEGVETTADKFAREWESKDFAEMYFMFIPELKQRKDMTDFIELMEYLEKDSTITVRLDKVSMESENTAYAYYSVSSSLFEQKAPAVKLEYIENAWKVNAFATYFDMNLQNKKYVDKYIEISKKETSLVIDFNYNMNIAKIGYSGLYDTTYCPNFKQNFEDAKKNYEEFISLDVPQIFQDYHNVKTVMYENQYKSFEEMYKSCIATHTYYTEKHLNKAQEYWKIVANKSDELQKMDKELEDKYKTEKEKSTSSTAS